ncbi:transmembrane emp24 domain-containing protein 9-like isoform X2 [Stegodyphus dumicola]|uniref:transmembrane emp24 domain-containing protein 9-like isoform X2 n=1 Tax=Stegodyphus dumicola TaxID=202533 RepID=UPI0015B1A056|nr:transmembrane emp24 domain-containing protein 9-like isoform X2 [Stegodyphus dumicola]
MHIFLVLVCFYIVGSTRALYFYIKKEENKCFLQELPSNTNLLGYYKSTPVLEYSSTFSLEEEAQKTKIKVEIQDPGKSITFSKLYRLEGVFSFTSHNPGSYLICLKPEENNYSWNKLKIHFALQVGERAINYTAVAQKEKLSEIELKFKQLIEKVSEVSKEQEYQRGESRTQ